jgi:hypothetical protein
MNQVRSNLLLVLHLFLAKIFMATTSIDRHITYCKDLLVIFVLLHQSPESELIYSLERTCITNGICLKLKTTSLRQSQIDQNIAATPIVSFFLCVVPWLATQFLVI